MQPIYFTLDNSNGTNVTEANGIIIDPVDIAVFTSNNPQLWQNQDRSLFYQIISVDGTTFTCVAFVGSRPTNGPR